jgi:CO/xanthine dehydrogenase FAD-binding subunit
LAVVDLQSLGLNALEKRGNLLEIGAMVTLQTLLDSDLPEALKSAIRHEATYNLRQAATVGGTLVSASGRSPFATALLALDAGLVLLPGGEGASLGNLLPFRQERLSGRLIRSVSISRNVRLAYEYVARTPADQPIVCVAAAVWPSGRVRLALGGYGAAPVMAFDGSELDGVDVAASSSYASAGDEWASAEYRSEVAGILAGRCLAEIEE